MQGNNWQVFDYLYIDRLFVHLIQLLANDGKLSAEYWVYSLTIKTFIQRSLVADPIGALVPASGNDPPSYGFSDRRSDLISYTGI